MPDISLGNNIFDLEFHPKNDHIYAGLVTGEIKAFAYDSSGSCEPTFAVRPTKRSCRSLATDQTGDRLWSGSKDKTIHAIDTTLGKVVDTRLAAHDSAINRVTQLFPNMFATGDDDGVIKLWDPRKPVEIRAYKQHFDFISDFLWLDDKRQLVATSGDGTLSVMDVRSNKAVPTAQSEDQEDELLSITAIKGNTKFVIGTQLGILSIFNRSKGWGDCVDRIPGHPSSIDAMCALTSDVILTGSSDGYIRAVEILPTKFLGVIADHGEFPIERLKLDRQSKWLGSASHDEVLKLTCIAEALEDSDEDAAEREPSLDVDVDGIEAGGEAGLGDMSAPAKQNAYTTSESDSDEQDLDDAPWKNKKKRRKKSQDSMGIRKKACSTGTYFFSGL